MIRISTFEISPRTTRKTHSIKQVNPTARIETQLDSLLPSLGNKSRVQETRLLPVETSCFPPQLIRLRHARSSSGTLRLYPFYNEGMCARVCKSFRRQRGRDTEGVRGIVREHFAARHYPSFCR